MVKKRVLRRMNTKWGKPYRWFLDGRPYGNQEFFSKAAARAWLKKVDAR